VPVLVFVSMLVVGMELTTNDFRRVVRQPRIIVAATVGQIVLLPVLGWVIARSLPHQLAVA
jgi:bile acid:Na+ symporter, BASS family